MKVKKRDGRVVEFDANKIRNAVEKAFESVDGNVSDAVREKAAEIAASIKGRDKDLSVEEIQDAVEKKLMASNRKDVAKEYILYRKQREKARNVEQSLLSYKDVVDNYLKVDDWRVKENSTVTYSIGGLILSNSGAITANYWLNEVYDKEIAEAHRKCDIHIHDLSMLSGYCAGWSLRQLIQEGLGGVPGKIASTPASHLSTLCNQMVNFLGIMQNEWSGAQAFSSFDTYLAPFVKVDNLTQKQVKQCIQSFVFGVNTPSRWGCVDAETEVLTIDGFKTYDKLQKGDKIYTWNNGTLELNAVKEIVVKQHDGIMHGYRGRGYHQYVTPDHRVLCKKHNKNEYVIRHSSEIFDVKTPYSFPARFTGSSLQSSKLSMDEIQMAAIIYCDGSIDMCGDGVHKVSIFKSPQRTGNELIEELANSLELEYRKREITSGFDSVVNQYVFYGDSARTLLALVGQKDRIADRFLTMDSLESNVFLQTWAAFDGREEKFMLQYDNDVIRDQLQHIAVRAGYTSYLESMRANYVKIRGVNNVTPSERYEEEYHGIVWCPNVDNGTAVFRKDGAVFISGQCQAPFSNVTLDWTVPHDMENLPAIVGGKEMDFTYGDCKKEMDMVNKAFLEVMIEGDANGRGFQYPIPTYSITRDFDWSDTENNRLLFEMTAKYGTPYFSNYINSDMEPSDVRSMCCRLRLDLRELRRKSGGFFGSGESTGSIGVVTINLPRLAYKSETEEDFYAGLDKLMDIAARSLDVKRKYITKLLDAGLYPYTKRYLGTFRNHFSTIGLVGMNEATLNAKWLGIDLTHEAAQQFAKDVLNHMRERLSDYQEQYGDLYNLEATPAESTTYRFAKHDKEEFPDIITANMNGTPYYTNSSHLPVGYTEDVFSALDVQDELQTLYTSGTVFHSFLGEKLPDWKAAAELVRKIAENYKLPYYTMSPTYSVCKDHGYLTGEQFKCPICGQPTEVYSRITGYYRPVQNWNDGKVQEYKDRREYKISFTHSEMSESPIEEVAEANEPEKVTDAQEALLFTTPTCPNCKMAKAFMDRAGFEYTPLNAIENTELVQEYGIKQAPTLVIKSDNNVEKYRGVSEIKGFLNARSKAQEV